MIGATTLDGDPVRIEPAALDALRRSLRGKLLLDGEPGYAEARFIWNAAIDRRPALIARCLGTGDIERSVAFAREHRLPLAVKGGGHNIAGLSLCDGGLVLDLSQMRGVWVNPAARTAEAQAGCLIGDVDRETQLHGLAALLGFNSTTGIAGLTLGGGFGYLTRRFGWTCDNVRAMTLVTADGRVLRVSDHEHADLFWALRGGGGNFGVVSSFEYLLHPVGPEIVGGVIAWRGEDAPAVLEQVSELIAGAPPELTCVVILRRAPPAPWLLPDVHGKLIVALAVCHSGPVDQAERDVAPLKRFAAAVGDVVQRRTYVSQQSLLDATQPHGRRYHWKSEYLPAIEGDVLAAALEQARKIVSPHSAVVLFPIGGAIRGLPDDHSPVGNRDANAVLNVMAAWEQASDDNANLEWARSAWEALRGFSTGGNYVNFLATGEPEARVRAAYGVHYGRLRAAKRRWDPDNLFRINKNIAPA